MNNNNKYVHKAIICHYDFFLKKEQSEMKNNNLFEKFLKSFQTVHLI